MARNYRSGAIVEADLVTADVTAITDAVGGLKGSGSKTFTDVTTNTAGLAASGGGGYVRQDSTGTIAKETGGNLASIAAADAKIANATEYVVSAAYKVTVTDSSATVATLTSAAIPSGMVRLALLPHDGAGVVNYNLAGAASASTAEVLPGGIILPITATLAGTTQLYAASGSEVVDILYMIPRA